jgi:hypothetical protein
MFADVVGAVAVVVDAVARKVMMMTAGSRIAVSTTTAVWEHG